MLKFHASLTCFCTVRFTFLYRRPCAIEDHASRDLMLHIRRRCVHREPLAPWEQHRMCGRRRALPVGIEIRVSNGLHGVFESTSYLKLTRALASWRHAVFIGQSNPSKDQTFRTYHPHIARCFHPLVSLLKLVACPQALPPTKQTPQLS